MVFQISSKPLIGLAGEKGCTLSYGPDLEKNGQKVAFMISELLKGKEIKDIIPTSSEVFIYKDESLLNKFKIKYP